MSDEFDREAEREKLREKYERDRAEREASERMSELLLQGATMTNRHCPECHSPVFSYEGTEFCPTCQREVTGEGESAGAADSALGEETAGGVGANGGATADAGTAPAGDGTGPDEEPEPTEDPRASEPMAEPGPEPGPADAETGPTDDAREPRRRQPREETRPAPARERRPARVDPPARREEPTTDRAGADREGLDDAEAALVREIANLTRRAEETRDVGRKREFFAAAREAAETLETVRRV